MTYIVTTIEEETEEPGGPEIPNWMPIPDVIPLPYRVKVDEETGRVVTYEGHIVYELKRNPDPSSDVVLVIDPDTLEVYRDPTAPTSNLMMSIFSRMVYKYNLYSGVQEGMLTGGVNALPFTFPFELIKPEVQAMSLMSTQATSNVEEWLTVDYSEVVDYNELTISQLQEALDVRNIEYKSNLRKAEYIELLKEGGV